MELLTYTPDRLDQLYYIALYQATDDDGVINDSLALSLFYELVKGAIKITVH